MVQDHRKKTSSPLMVLVVLLGCFAVCLSLAVGILRWSAGQNTVLQYGSPEYEIEVPQDYEDLRVVRPDQNSETGQPASPSPATVPSDSQPAPSPAQSTTTQTSAAHQPAPARMAPGQPPVLIFVIDDAGYRLDQLEKFLKLPFPLTIAVLPRVTYSAESAVRITNAGKELILHQPMQALGGKNPGEGAVLLSMDDETIRATVDSNLASLGYPRGMNNHMGSAVTLDRRAMTAVLQLVKQYGMY
ncbi:MAG: divergent polysaccharide deacetylase family protein, partial [Spirochaetales bacterium]|nr:divergent polysaccharide deacetylase family protein [Spirochaetales bacterium]